MADKSNSKSNKSDEPIVIDEGGDEVPDEELKIAENESPNPTDRLTNVAGNNTWSRFKTWYGSHKKKSIPLTVLAIILLSLIIPQTRYSLPGLFYKKDYSIKITDSVTHTPVSGASVSSGGVTAETDGQGQAKLHLSLGAHNLTITKSYYDSQNLKVTVPLLDQKSVPEVSFHANGRQVKITVTNKINHKPVADTTVKFSDSEVKTGADGTALAVVPESTKSADVTLSHDGYNDNQSKVVASDSEIKNNDLTITPSGKVYFLSKLSGKIDVVKTDLDGQNRAKVLGGTGNEQDTNTVLLASRDWKYLALLSRRASAEGDPILYLIDTSTDKLTVVDQGKATFIPIGWDDHYFLYQADRHERKNWQAGQSALKSYNADNQQIVPLDETKALGTSQSNYARETYDYYYHGANNFYIVNHNLIYSKSWDWSYDNDSLVKTKTNGIYEISVSGAVHQTLLSYKFDQYLDSFLYKPQEIYYQLQASSPKYYAYQNGNLNYLPSIKSDYLKNEDNYASHTYLQSPDGSKVFWYEELDGKNSLYLGGVNADNPATVGRSEDFIPYGWYTDDYLLMSKNSSELYVMPKTGMSDQVKPTKITDYHKPARSFYGYGGGYGGL